MVLYLYFFRFNTWESSKTCAYLAESNEDPLFILFELRNISLFYRYNKKEYFCILQVQKRHEG